MPLDRRFPVATITYLDRVQPKEDAGNLAKHGVSLGLAYELDWNAALVWVDDRFEYDELRMIALAPRTNTLYYVAFVDRGDVTDRAGQGLLKMSPGGRVVACGEEQRAQPLVDRRGGLL